MKAYFDFQKMLQIFSGIDEGFGKRPVLRAVRSGLIYMIPLLMIGSFSLIILSLPVPAYQDMMKSIFGTEWRNIFLYVRDGTFNILSLLMAVCISYSYAVESSDGHFQVSPVITTSVSLCSFIIIMNFGKEGFSVSKLGVIGVFVAIIVSLTSSMLFLKLSSIRSLRMKAFTDGASASFNYALNSIIPAAITVGVFSAINQGITHFFGITDIQIYLSDFLCSLFAKIESTSLSSILFILLVHIFWFFGMHGNNILEPVAQDVFVTAMEKNQASVQAGLMPTEIFTKTFFDIFVLMGGCGATLCLIAAIFIWGRHKNQRRLAKMSFLPVFFNINELMVFGMPIVLNPIFIIPFLFVPVILTSISYIAIKYGIVPYTQNLVEWTTPVFLSGYAATGSIKGSLLQLFNLIIGILCYLPFVKLAEGVSAINMKNNLQKVYLTLKNEEAGNKISSLLSRTDDTGNIAKYLAADLEYDLNNDKLQLFYQPQVDFDGNVTGLEALLRWKHESYGYIFPPLIIAMAEETQLIEKLGYWIIDTACRDFKVIHNSINKNIVVSVNISAMQLENPRFADEIREILAKHDLEPNMLKIEITEQLALINSRKILDQIISIKDLGVRLAMDDFGMGHSSLMYLKEYQFDTIKLDGSLVKEIISNNNCKNIVSTIVALGKSLNYNVIAEYVETEDQRQILHELGCNQYQGYLYSKAVPINEALEFILERSQKGISPAEV